MTPADRLANPSGCPFVGPQKPRRAPWWRRVRHRSPLLRYLFPPSVWSGVIVEDKNGARARVLYERMGMVHYEMIDGLGYHHAADRRYFAGVFRKV